MTTYQTVYDQKRNHNQLRGLSCYYSSSDTMLDIIFFLSLGASEIVSYVVMKAWWLRITINVLFSFPVEHNGLA